jgi:hypothetical protein
MPMKVHLGYEKSGSTWLQQYVFPRILPGKFLWVPEYVGQAMADHPQDAALVLRELVGVLKPDAELISSEVFSTGIGRFSTRDFAKAIMEAYPDAEIFVTYRDPKAVLAAKWLSAVVQNTQMTPLRFSDWAHEAMEKGVLGRLLIDSLLAPYADLIEKSRVYPLLIESMGVFRSLGFTKRIRHSCGSRRYDLGRWINSIAYGDNTTTRNDWLVRMWLFHNRTVGPLFRAGMRCRWTRQWTKLWVYYGRRAVNRFLDRVLPDNPTEMEIPKWILDWWEPRIRGSYEYLEREFPGSSDPLDWLGKIRDKAEG